MAPTTTVRTLRKALKAKSPSLLVERELWDAGHEIVVGMDEVGRGAWAGPISVGAAVLPQNKRVYKIRDSKMLTPGEREAMFDRIASWCVTWAVGHASQIECDTLEMGVEIGVAVTLTFDITIAGGYFPTIEYAGS